MHGTSYAELERAVGPEGSAGERVARFAFCRGGPSTSWKGDRGKLLLIMPLYTLLCFCVSGTDYCNTPVSCYCSGLLMHQRHETNCSAQNTESVECIFLSSIVHNILKKKNTSNFFQKTTGLCQTLFVVKKSLCLWPSKQVFQAKTLQVATWRKCESLNVCGYAVPYWPKYRTRFFSMKIMCKSGIVL